MMLGLLQLMSNLVHKLMFQLMAFVLNILCQLSLDQDDNLLDSVATVGIKFSVLDFICR